MTSKQHTLKIHPKPLDDLLSGAKTCEIRFNDRGFQVGDTVRLQEIDPATEQFTGRTDAVRIITHIQQGYGLPDHLCVLSYAQPAAGEPVAWQWRSRIKGGAWDAWENGRYDFEPAPFMDVEHRALYAAPPAAAPVAAGEPVASAKQLAASLKLVRRFERQGQAPEWEFEVPGGYYRYVIASSEKIARAIVAQDLRREAPPAAAHGHIPSVSGIGQDAGHPRSLLLYLRSEPTDDDIRAIQGALRGNAAEHGDEAVPNLVPGLQWAIDYCNAMLRQGNDRMLVEVIRNRLENVLGNQPAAMRAQAGEGGE